MSFVDDLIEEFRDREQEHSVRESHRHARLLLLQEHGPVFFEDLKGQIRAALKQMSARHVALKSILFEDVARSGFMIRSTELRPMVRVTVTLSSTNLVIRVESREHGSSVEVERLNEKVEFGVDADNRLMLCMHCRQVDIDDVAKTILRHALGL